MSSDLWAAVVALQRALQAKDPYTTSHSARVRRLAVAMAGELGQGHAFAREIGLAAELHDIGKIGIPDELLHKAGPLSAEERTRVLEHAVIGARILEPLLGRYPLVLAVVRWHHEWADGSGYPDGLRAAQVPLAARIVSVADAFDAMTSERPYRAACPAHLAEDELVRCAGTQFDGRCVQALLAVVGRS
ncbi:MAG TPA: HD-GYP domain-containing protein [Gemmatimonadales bacterium]|nr:HD-GYP domain-containing protein [Gemmatimonadales bacterium]